MRIGVSKFNPGLKDLPVVFETEILPDSDLSAKLSRQMPYYFKMKGRDGNTYLVKNGLVRCMTRIGHL